MPIRGTSAPGTPCYRHTHLRIYFYRIHYTTIHWMEPQVRHGPFLRRYKKGPVLQPYSCVKPADYLSLEALKSNPRSEETLRDAFKDMGDLLDQIERGVRGAPAKLERLRIEHSQNRKVRKAVHVTRCSTSGA